MYFSKQTHGDYAPCYDAIPRRLCTMLWPYSQASLAKSEGQLLCHPFTAVKECTLLFWNNKQKQAGQEKMPVCAFFMQTLLSWWYFFSFLFILNYYLFIVHGCSWIQAYYGQCVKVRGQFLRFCSLLLPWILGIKLMFRVCKTSTFTC